MQPTDALKAALAGLTAPAPGTLLAPGQVIADPQLWVKSVRQRAAWALRNAAGRPRAAWACAYLVREIAAARGDAQLVDTAPADDAFKRARAKGLVVPLLVK